MRKCHKIFGAAAIHTELSHRFRKDLLTVSFAIGKESPSRPQKFLKKGSFDLLSPSYQGLKPGRVKIGNRSLTSFSMRSAMGQSLRRACGCARKGGR